MLKISRDILSLAIPSIVSNVTVPLLGMADTAIAGHMGDAKYIAAISLGSTAFSMFYWLFSFLRMSTSGLVSQAYGANNRGLALDVLLKSSCLGLLVAFLLLVFQRPLFHLVLMLTPAKADVLLPLHSYFSVCIWGAPAILLNYSLHGWFIGHQNTRILMFAALFQNVVNIFFSLLFVYVLGWGIRGVACGTLFGVWSGFFFLLFHLCNVVKNKKHARCSKIRWVMLFSINRDIFLRTLCLVSVTVYFTRAGSLQQSGVLEANAVLLQFFLLFSFFMDGFANAGEALAGKFYGRKDRLALRQMIANLFAWGGGVALFFSLLYIIGGRGLLGLFTNQQSVLFEASKYQVWIWLLPLLSFSAFLWDGIFIGLTCSRQMLLSMFVAMLFFFFIWFVLHASIGNHALWLAFDAYLLTRGMLQWWMYSKIKNAQ